MNKLINLLSNSGYIILNKEIIRKMGLHEAVILGELCSEYTYWEREKRLDDNYFYSTRENIENETGLSPYQQRTAIENLIRKGILITKKVGMPSKIWYSFNETVLFKIFIENDDTYLTTSSKKTSLQDVKKLNNKESNNLTTGSKKIRQQDVKKLDTNNNNTNNNNNNNKEKEEKISYAEKVYMKKTEYNEMTSKYSSTKVDAMIQELNLYKKSTGKEYEDDYATILRWLKRENDKNKSKMNYEQRDYSDMPDEWWNQLYANNQWCK